MNKKQTVVKKCRKAVKITNFLVQHTDNKVTVVQINCFRCHDLIMSALPKLILQMSTIR